MIDSNQQRKRLLDFNTSNSTMATTSSSSVSASASSLPAVISLHSLNQQIPSSSKYRRNKMKGSHPTFVKRIPFVTKSFTEKRTMNESKVVEENTTILQKTCSKCIPTSIQRQYAKETNDTSSSAKDITVKRDMPNIIDSIDTITVAYNVHRSMNNTRRNRAASVFEDPIKSETNVPAKEPEQVTHPTFDGTKAEGTKPLFHRFSNEVDQTSKICKMPSDRSVMSYLEEMKGHNDNNKISNTTEEDFTSYGVDDEYSVTVVEREYVQPKEEEQHRPQPQHHLQINLIGSTMHNFVSHFTHPKQNTGTICNISTTTNTEKISTKHDITLIEKLKDSSDSKLDSDDSREIKHNQAVNSSLPPLLSISVPSKVLSQKGPPSLISIDQRKPRTMNGSNNLHSAKSTLPRRGHLVASKSNDFIDFSSKRKEQIDPHELIKPNRSKYSDKLIPLSSSNHEKSCQHDKNNLINLKFSFTKSKEVIKTAFDIITKDGSKQSGINAGCDITDSCQPSTGPNPNNSKRMSTASEIWNLADSSILMNVNINDNDDDDDNTEYCCTSTDDKSVIDYSIRRFEC